MLKKFLLSPLVTFIFFLSCSSNERELEQQRNVLDVFASKTSILSLPIEEQKQAWIGRLEMYAELDLSLEQKTIIEKLTFDLKNLGQGSFYISEAIKEDAIAFAKVTPKDDFLRLFCSETISEGLPILSKKGSICIECITDLENYVCPSSQPSNVAVSFRIEDCDCLWTCQQQADNLLCDEGETATVVSECQSGQNAGCCNAASGCGLFLLQTCTGKAECVPDNEF